MLVVLLTVGCCIIFCSQDTILLTYTILLTFIPIRYHLLEIFFMGKGKVVVKITKSFEICCHYFLNYYFGIVYSLATFLI